MDVFYETTLIIVNFNLKSLNTNEKAKRRFSAFYKN